MSKVFIIAEAGVNHNGSLKTAKRLIDAAVKAGVNAVKFQTFDANCLVSIYAPKARYQKIFTRKNETQLEMLKRVELSGKAHRILIEYCRKKGMIFISSPFDFKSVDLLNELGVQIIKIPSGEITNVPYLRKIGSLKKKVILSTGMSYLKEIKCALDILISAGTKKENITILHCNTEYPTPMEAVNLRAMLTIKEVFKINTGYSDHTLGIYVPIAAAALGASIIEKHFTLNKKMKGPDHRISLEPAELKQMVTAIRNIEKALGDGVKKPSKSELENLRIVRKSIVAAKAINKGDILSEDNIMAKRPATGISPLKWDKIIGARAKKDFQIDEIIIV